MAFLRSALSELISLFVDDWAFAVAVIAWIGLCALLRVILPATLHGPILVVGLGALTIGFVVRQARRLGAKK